MPRSRPIAAATERAYLDVDDLAARFRVSAAYVRARCHDGTWPHLKTPGPGGKRFQFRPSDVEAIEELYAFEPDPPAARRRATSTQSRRRA